jgi:hypothetical protein
VFANPILGRVVLFHVGFVGGEVLALGAADVAGIWHLVLMNDRDVSSAGMILAEVEATCGTIVGDSG